MSDGVKARLEARKAQMARGKDKKGSPSSRPKAETAAIDI